MRQKTRDTLHNFFHRITDKRVLFWILNGAYWITYWLYICLIHAWVRNFPPKILFWCSLIASTGFILCVFMRYVFKHLNIASYRLISIFIVTVIVTTVTANLWYGFDLLLDQLLKSPDSPVASVTFRNYLTFTFYWQLLLIAWSVFYFVVKFWMAWNEQKRRTEKADLLEKRSQLQMLRYQLNPHFLFNALNSVRALVDEDERNAKVMITELSEFLRYTLMVICKMKVHPFL
ncbi:histidine kinase [candidate division KSB1 bacterium]|nr:histidine kinase [candidate division KSB1 bacterium]